jgi:hypothetical protein
MSTAGTILLGTVEALAPEIAIACRICSRYGKLRTERLLREHGPDMQMPHLLRLLAADCPRLGGPNQNQRCDVHCPTLSELSGSNVEPESERIC